MFSTLGPAYARKHDVTPSRTTTKFDPEKAMDPTFLNECSTTALRFGHSQDKFNKKEW